MYYLRFKKKSCVYFRIDLVANESKGYIVSAIFGIKYEMQSNITDLQHIHKNLKNECCFKNYFYFYTRFINIENR